MEEQLSEVERKQKEFQGAQSQAKAKLITLHEANEERWEKQLTELGEDLQKRMSADVKLIIEDMLGLADSMNRVTAQFRANQKELSKLNTEVTNSFNNFQAQSTSLQDNLSGQILSFMLEVKQEISRSASAQVSTDDSTKSHFGRAQSPIRPKGTRYASSTQFPKNIGKTRTVVLLIIRSRVT